MNYHMELHQYLCRACGDCPSWCVFLGNRSSCICFSALNSEVACSFRRFRNQNHMKTQCKYPLFSQHFFSSGCFKNPNTSACLRNAMCQCVFTDADVSGFIDVRSSTDLCWEGKSQCLHLSSWTHSQVKSKAVHSNHRCFLHSITGQYFQYQPSERMCFNSLMFSLERVLAISLKKLYLYLNGLAPPA